MTTEEDKEKLRLQWEDVRLQIARREAGRKTSFLYAMFFGVCGFMFGCFYGHDLGYRSPLALGILGLSAAWPTFWLIYSRMQKSISPLVREEKELRYRLTGEDHRDKDPFMKPLASGLLLMASIICSLLVFFIMLELA